MHTNADAFHSRRDFLTRLFAELLVGAGILQVARHAAAWTQALPPAATPGQFEIQKVAADLYSALARPWELDNSNAAIFVNSSDVLVVDAHSHPAAAAALIAQIKNEVTSKPVRWLVNTHFHWDHTQGNRAYLSMGNQVDIVASNATKQLMSQLLVPRLRAALDPASLGPRGSQQVARQLGDLRERAGKATSETEKVPLSLQFSHILPGHGRMQHDRRDMIGCRNYIEELTERVLAGKKAGQSVADLQRTITAASLKSLHAQAFVPASTPEEVERGIKNSIDNVYDRVEKVSFTGTEPVRLRA